MTARQLGYCRMGNTFLKCGKVIKRVVWLPGVVDETIRTADTRLRREKADTECKGGVLSPSVGRPGTGSDVTGLT